LIACLQAYRAGFVLIWLSMQRISPALAPILFVPGLLNEALVRARNGLYTARVLPRRRLPGPVISVGNITVGGTGKTPLVLYIAQALSKQDFQPAILTRGYKRSQSHKTLILPPGENVLSAGRALGDEPAILRRHIPSAWMGVSKNRFWAGSRISQQLQKPVFILDDGFQHRKLHRDLDIVILDCSQPLQSNRVFPRGTLREPLSGLHRCSVVVLNGAQGGNLGGAIVETLACLAPKAAIFRCTQSIASMAPFRAWSEMTFGGQSQQPRSAYLVAAIGNPERFEQDVRRLGIDVVGTKFYYDHYWISPQDWQACAGDARSRNAEAIVTTEKDAVKIAHPPDFPLMVSIQSTAISNAAAFEMMLRQCVENRRREQARECGTH
jgi:tetraacyldisaccharide 4'-kinase